jgi:cytochrome c-type biogenesis protein CcsB
MLQLSQFTLVAGLLLVLLSVTCYVVAFASRRSAQQVLTPAHVTSSGGGVDLAEPPVMSTSHDHHRSGAGLATYGTYFAWLALASITLSLIFRTVLTGHGPFANQYEFSVAFAWGMLAAYVYFERRYHIRTLALLILPVTAALLLYAMTVGDTAVPLVPALQNNLLLSVHVAAAIVAYGAFTVGSAAAALYLVSPEGGRPRLPKPAYLEEISYRSVIIGFPFLTMVIVLGAVWAEQAWGTYWSWDPKETASLVTWLIYGAYLHARVVRGWRGRRAAWLLMLGFGAILLTFFGNLFFGGLHSYAGTPQG